MKQIYTEQQLEAMAQNIFEQYPNENKVFATADGNIFINQNHAKIHAGKARVLTFDRLGAIASETKSEAFETEVKEKVTATRAIEIINAATDKAELDPFMSDTRATVKKALEEKLKSFEVVVEPTSTETEESSTHGITPDEDVAGSQEETTIQSEEVTQTSKTEE